MYADVIYLDFAKVFDKVDHGILLKKRKKWTFLVYADSQISLRQKATSCRSWNSCQMNPPWLAESRRDQYWTHTLNSYFRYWQRYSFTIQPHHLPTTPEFSNWSVASKIAIVNRKILTKSLNDTLPTIRVSIHVNLNELDICFPMVTW